MTAAASPGRPQATRPRRTAATKQKLFDAALRLVGERGAAGVTVDEIAAGAGVAKGTVYYNFGSKDALVDAMLRHGVDLLAERLRVSEDAEPPEAVAALVEGMLGFFGEYPAFAQLLVSELWRTPGQWHGTLSLLRDDIVSIVRAQVQRLADLGRLPDGVQVGTASAALFGTLLVVALDWQVFQPERELAEVRDSVLALVRGLT
ncbi:MULTISPECIES: TetR/AcrR family transcriptional regulator [Actinosynnema]|uniref:Transcriptional regulator, TetR family n=2 Tax=Actinosynnema TaxID=40566 RepID=C6WB54_ACTMD|nr:MULTISPECIES: TetR/AcrR family transcriptional regulator [Actinosynnema]ACU39345.1 transcriptional regulator, TetR family [Actinosynnema mirum DSM 43827]ATE56570.1 TetR/AcrR family transcriptional regulator [Actinosynnema pretiosum]AXX32944.1 Transcriptional regulator, TetR family [Actinosynnema pretiosum subsp. pretiosum]